MIFPFIPSGPPRTLVSLDVHPGYKYDVYARATAAHETAMTERIFCFTVPTEIDSCSFHLRNRGITVRGTNATIEFGGVQTSSFRCQHGDNEPEPCVFTAG